ncbi:serine hydrolase domain-containing protein [Nonomuraea sp. NPDC059023]|uniref:serine hydrolase domain-containing protein n=1 Tax=unclassified Nonomuraea TaxID=2593643 RepID=UPI00367588C1
MLTPLMLTLALLAPPPQDASLRRDLDASLGRDLDAWLRRDLDAVRDLGVIGAVAEVRDGARHLSARTGVADRATRRPVPRRPQIRVASATKAFTATVLLQLSAEGRLAVDDSASRWLPRLDPRITVRHLLQQTSGLADDDHPGSVTEEGYLRHRLDTVTPHQVVERARKLFDPGTGWNYANVNSVIAGMIIEKVTGQSWERQVTDRVIVPLGLTSTYAPGPVPYLAGPHLTGYRQFAERGRLVDTTVANQSAHRAAGDLISTPGDLARFFTALVTGKLLRPAQLAEMRKTVPVSPFYQKLLPGMRYGLGLMWFPLTCGNGYWTHWGDALGYSTRGGVTPDGRRVVMVHTNTNGDALQARFHRKLHPLVDRALCGGRS